MGKSAMMCNGSDIDTVLLDMDGTLLDLAFDRVFWREEVPDALSAHRGIPVEHARQLMEEKYQAVSHTLNWYCLDYWSEALQLDIHAMLWAHRHRVRLRPDTLPFLQMLRRTGKRTILLTNAHPWNLDVKRRQTGLAPHLDLLLSTHTFGYPKEDQRLWQAVAQHTGFDASRTLFIDDNEILLDVAKSWGIGWCLGIRNPDSGRPEQPFQRHYAISHYRTVIQAWEQL